MRRRRLQQTLLAPASSADMSGVHEPQYSVCQEVRFFFSQGLPLLLLNILKTGVPPLFTMLVAGRTPESATLQASLGYARTFYNCITLMPLMALCQYFSNVVPGALGAGRVDRVPRYFWRSTLLTSMCILPSIVALCFADVILAAVGVPPSNAQGVGVYSRYMVVTAWLTLLDNHLENCFINFRYVNTAAANGKSRPRLGP